MGGRAAIAFQEGLAQLIYRMRKEWDLTFAECVGVLELVKIDVWNEAAGWEDDDGEVQEEAGCD